MTDRVADITARIDGIRQLGAVVNAMRGIAAARAQQARGQLAAVDVYAATIAAAISRSLSLLPANAAATVRSTRPSLVVFCAEQGFVGNFTERVLDSVRADLADCELFLIGTRGAAIAAERGIKAAWHSSLPSHSPGMPNLADRVAEALYHRIASGEIDRLDAVFGCWQPGRGFYVQRSRLFPLDMATFARAADTNPAAESDAGGAAERTDGRLPACATLPCGAARIRGGKSGAHGGNGRGAHANRAPAWHVARAPTAGAARGNNRGNH